MGNVVMMFFENKLLSFILLIGPSVYPNIKKSRNKIVSKLFVDLYFVVFIIKLSNYDMNLYVLVLVNCGCYIFNS